MIRISAHYIITNTSRMLKRGIIEINRDGIIQNIVDTRGELKETRNIEFFNGVICPGFINAHCHLELSYLNGKIQKHLFLHGFIEKMRHLKLNDEEVQLESLNKAEEELIKNGVVGVGDISNSEISFKVKKKSPLKYHTFIELFGPDDANAESIFNKGIYLRDKYRYEIDDSVSITPHAPYSVSTKLFYIISEYIKETGKTCSLHNQESMDENLYFIKQSGSFPAFFASLYKDFRSFRKTGKSSIQSIFHHLQESNTILLVHNTFINKDDLEFLKPYLPKIYFVLCPNSNLFIENKLPPVGLINQFSKQVAIGTDSLASNNELSVLEELKTLSAHFPQLELPELIKWGTLNGAKALGFNNLGSIQINSKPGINLLYDLDLHNLKLTKETKVKVII